MGLLTHLDLEVDDFVDDFDLEAVFLEPFEAALAGPRETDRRGRGGGWGGGRGGGWADYGRGLAQSPPRSH